MGTWAKEAAERYKLEAAAKLVESERFVTEDRLRHSLAPEIWEELRLWLKAECTDYNSEIGKGILAFEVWPSTKVVIRRTDKPATLKVDFDKDAQRVRYSCGAGQGEFLFKVNPDMTVILPTAYDVPYSVEEVGKLLLDLLMKSPF